MSVSALSAAPGWIEAPAPLRQVADRLVGDKASGRPVRQRRRTCPDLAETGPDRLFGEPVVAELVGVPAVRARLVGRSPVGNSATDHVTRISRLALGG